MSEERNSETSRGRQRLRGRFEAGEKLLLGVVHLIPLPGSPRYRFPASGAPLAEAIRRALADARALIDAGFDGLVVENFGDVPFWPREVPPWVISSMTRLACELRQEGKFTVANVLRNDPRAGLSIALAADLDAIRVNVHTGAMVTDQGIVEGRAAETLRTRRELDEKVAILADIDVKHASPVGQRVDIAESAKDCAYRGLADALIVTGAATGSPTSDEDLTRVRAAVPDRPLLIGSGADHSTVARLLQTADGVIVGSALKPERDVAQPIDRDLARRFVDAARRTPR